MVPGEVSRAPGGHPRRRVPTSWRTGTAGDELWTLRDGEAQIDDLGFCTEPPDGIDPSTYALRDQIASADDLDTWGPISGNTSRHLTPLPRRWSASCGLGADCGIERHGASVWKSVIDGP